MMVLHCASLRELDFCLQKIIINHKETVFSAVHRFLFFFVIMFFCKSDAWINAEILKNVLVDANADAASIFGC